MFRYRVLLILFGLLSVGVVLIACASTNAEKRVETATAAVKQSPGSTIPTYVTVFKSPACGCCTQWITHLEEHGFDVEEKDMTDMAAVKREHRIPPQLLSCHTAVIGDYVIEGHVPAQEIQRLLTEQPEGVVGLAVAGMPVGSPGMEYGDKKQPYKVFAFDESGNFEVFARYGE